MLRFQKIPKSLKPCAKMTVLGVSVFFQGGNPWLSTES